MLPEANGGLASGRGWKCSHSSREMCPFSVQAPAGFYDQSRDRRTTPIKSIRAAEVIVLLAFGKQSLVK